MTVDLRRPGLSAARRPARRHHRRGLLATSALVGSVLLAASAHAQILPQLPGNPPLPATANGADIAVSGNTMTIDINDASRIIDFASYNIGLGDTVAYTTDDPSLTGLVAVNRVLTGGGASQIDGSIMADLGGGNSISVWLINQEGIAFGSDATFSGGSLMLSTLDFTDTVDAAFRAAFAAPGAASATPFSFSGASTAPIVLGSPNLNVAGSIIAIGQNITADSALTATDGAIVLVAGTDVTFGSGLGNPLSFTINAGTAIGGAVNVNDSLTGRSVIVAGGIQDNLTAALLNVNAGATLTATADGGTVTIATASTGGITIGDGIAAAPSIALGGNLVTTGAAADVVVSSAADVTGAGGIDATGDVRLTAARAIDMTGAIESGADIAVISGSDATLGGDLTAGNDVSFSVGGNAQAGGAITAGRDIVAAVGGDAAFSGALAASRDVDLAAPGTMTVAGDVDAGRDYRTQGASVTLGTGGAAHSQNAGRLVTAQATTGDVTGLGALSLSSGGGSDITLQADAGQVDFAATTALNAGTGNVVVTSAPAITLGNVTAAGLFTAGGTALTAAGPITTGNLTIADALTINATAGAVTTGDITVQGPGAALTILAGGAGDVTTGALATDRGDILVSAARDITLGSASTALADPADAPVAGSIGLRAGRAIQAGALIAGEDIAASSLGTITVASAMAGDDIDFSADGDIALANGTVLGTGTGARSILFAGAPGAAGSVGFGAEQPALSGSILRLRSFAGGIGSAGTLANDGLGNIVIDAMFGPVSINAARALGGTIALNGTSVDAAFLQARDNVFASGGTVSIGSATAVNGLISLAADTSASLGTGAAATLIDIVSIGTIDSTGSLTTTAGDVRLDANAISVNAVTAGGGDFIATSAGAITGTGIAADLDVTVNAGTDATLAAATAGGQLSVTAGNDISVGTGSAAGSLQLFAGGSITSTNTLASTGGAVALEADDAIAVATLAADGGFAFLRSNFSSVDAGSVSAQTFVNVEAASDAALGSASAGTSLNVTAGNNASVGTGLGGTLVGILAGGAIDSATSLTAATGDLQLDAVGDITVAAVSASLGNASLTSTAGSITATTVAAGTDITVLAADNASLGSATSGNLLTVGALGDVSVGEGSAGLIDIDAGGTIASATSLTASGDVVLDAGRDIAVNFVLAGGAANLTAARSVTGADVNAGADINVLAGADVDLGSAFAGNALIIDAGGNVAANGVGTTLVDILAGGSIASGTSLETFAGDVTLNAGGDVTVNALTARGLATITAGGRAAGTDVRADGTLRVSGASVDLAAAATGANIDVDAIGNARVDFGTAAAAIEIDAASISSAGSLQSTGGGVFLAAAGAIDVGDVTAASLADLNAGGFVTAALVSAANVGIVAGSDATLGILAGAIDVNAGRDVRIADAISDFDINIVAGNDALIALADAQGGLFVTAARDAAVGEVQGRLRVDVLAGNSISSTGRIESDSGNVRLRAGRDIMVNDLNANTNADLTATTGSVTGQDFLGGDITVSAATDASLASATATGALNVDAGGKASVGTGEAGSLIRIDAGGTLTSATSLTTTNGDVRLTAGGNIAAAALTAGGAGNASVTSATGSITGASIAAGTNATITAATDATLASASAGGALNVDAGGNASVGTGQAGSLIDINAGGTLTSATSLTTTNGDVRLTAGGNVALAALTAGGTGNASVTSATGSITAASIGAGTNAAITAATDATLTSATATGALDVDAGGNVSVGTGQAGSLIDINAGGTLTSATSLTTTNGDVRLAAGGNVALAALTAGGTGNASVTSATGSITGASIAAGTNATITAATDATLTSASARGALNVDAGGNASVGTGQAESLIRIDAGGTLTSATSLTTTGGDVRLSAGGIATLGQVTANAGGAAIVVEAADVTLNGAVTANSGGTVTLRNIAARPTVVGDVPKTTAAAFRISDAELDRVTAATVVIDAMANDLELATLSIAAGTGSGATRFLSTGNVELTGPLSVAPTGTPRTVQIGGALDGLGDDAGAANLARTIIARIDQHENPVIDAGSAIVELRGAKVLFGTGAMVDAYLPLSDDAIAAFVGDRGSLLYVGAPLSTRETFLTARQVTVAYRNFALFQNTRPTQFGGVAVNSAPGAAPDPTQLAIRLISTGETSPNSFAMFGTVDGFIGTTAAVLTNDAVQISNPGDAGTIRVNRANSRLNGCVIGAPERGCLSTDVPQPRFEFYDERRVALFDAGDDSTVAVSPLIGRGNDGLIVNVADAPVGIDTIECKPDDPNCNKTGGE